MPRSRKRHHSHSKSRSRSRSRSRSPYSRDRDHSYDRHRERDEKDGKRRKVDALDSPQNRSLSPTNDVQPIQEDQRVQDVAEVPTSKDESFNIEMKEKTDQGCIQNVEIDGESEDKQGFKGWEKHAKAEQLNSEEENKAQSEQINEDKISNNSNDKASEDIVELSDSDTGSLDTSKQESSIDTPKKEKLSNAARKEQRASLCSKPLTPKQMQKKAESEKRRQEKLKEKEEKLKQKQEEKAKILEEKMKQKQQKDEEKQKQLEEKKKQLEQKQKEKELKEEQKKKEREEKELKRKEKEQLEEQKRKEKEIEKLKKQQEIEEKEKEKQKEEEKKQKSAKLMLSFIKKSDNVQPEEKKTEKIVASRNNNFMPFEIKSDMKLPPLLRREPLTKLDVSNLDHFIENQNDTESYLKDLKNGKQVGKSGKTWPVEDDVEEDDVMVVDDKKLGETICEDTSTVKKMRAKFLSFHENRRPPYFGTWRKKSKFIKARKPLGEDTNLFNYEEDSDDDWEEEEQGESLDQSDGEQDKETEEEKDDYEVDNEFFVPHGHLSDDEMNDEENARLSPESMKQKLKLLKDEFEEDMKSKTHKLKPRSIGCVWFNKAGDNVEEAIQRYLQPFAALVNGQVEIKKRSEIFNSERKKVKVIQELPQDHIPLFLNIIHGNPHNQKALVEQFLTYMANNEMQVDISKTHLTRYLKKCATYKKCKEPGSMKNKSAWFLNEDVREKYNITFTDKSDKTE